MVLSVCQAQSFGLSSALYLFSVGMDAAERGDALHSRRRVYGARTEWREAPWGGYKQSRFGRELGTWGIEEYLETKQVHVNLNEQPVGWY